VKLVARGAWYKIMNINPDVVIDPRVGRMRRPSHPAHEIVTMAGSESPADTSATINGKTARPKGGHPADTLLSCVVVEDQAMFLEMLGSMLSLRGGLRVVDRVRSVAEGEASCRKHRPDLLILDLTLGDGDGLDVARACIEANPNGQVIIVTGNANDFVCPAWLNDTLKAVISKNETFQSLRDELDSLLGAVRPIAVPASRQPASGVPLTAREAEIFTLIGQGLTSREIGERLHISEHTVQTHRKRAAAKLGTQGDELVRIAITQQAAYFSKPLE
jgi:DNA-binding NarL/FixJ family response regulator